MSQKLKLLFDECVGRPILKSLSELLAASEQKPELSHILEFQEQGVLDEVWIPKVAADGWIIVTADRGKRGRGQKLPLVCRQFSITHVMLSATVHQKKNFDKVRIILGLWPEVAQLSAKPPGSGFSLQMTTAGHAKLVQVYSPLV